MLVLSRKLNESIVINYDIVVTVLSVQGDRVRLGIDAPGEIPVHRQEVYQKMQNQELLTECRLAGREPLVRGLGLRFWGVRQERIGKCDAAVQLSVILFRHKVLRQFRPAAFWKDTVSILPDDAEFVVGDLPQHRFQFVPL